MPNPHWSTETYSVRERFGTGVLMLATLYVAVLLAVLEALGAPWRLTLFVFGLVLWVTLAQLAFRRWSEPRLVSALAGAAYFVAWTVYSAVDDGGPSLVLVAWGPVAGLLGVLPGYFAGGLAASVFLFHDFFRDTLRTKRVEQEALRTAMGESPRESPFDD